MNILMTTIALLFAGNIFFIKKLVDKIESASNAASEAKQSMATLKNDVNAIGTQLRDLKSDIKDLRRVEIEMAVVKAQMSLRHGAPNSGD